MAGLQIRLSITDILLVEHIIKCHMKENNIKKINDIDVKVIQEIYDEMIKKHMWENPEKFINDR